VQLYENIFKYGKDVYFERVFDTETKKSTFLKSEVKPYVYIEGDGDKQLFLDKSIQLQKKQFDSDSLCDAYCDSMKDMGMSYYGKSTYKYQYLKDKFYYDDDMNLNDNNHDMRTWYLDIEVGSSDGFPFPHEAKEAVTLIQFYDNFDDKYYVIGLKDIEGLEDPRNIDKCEEYNRKYEFPERTTFIKAKSEKHLFQIFIKMIKTKLPCIWTAWNGDLFDFPYLVNRASKLGINKNELSPVNRVKYKYTKEGSSDSYDVDIMGIYLLDIMELYKKFTFAPQVSYSLNNIATVELGAEKVEYGEYDNLDELMENNYIKFVKYGIVDSQLIKEIDEKLNLINLVKSIAYKMGICLNDALGTVKPWGTYITNIAFKNGHILPNDGGNRDSTDTIKGAWVADPVIGKHGWVVSFDWASLYPSIIRWCNFSPETWVPTNQLPPELQEIRKT
jgi:DNA polymerase elongation subunit (family B)